MQTFDSKTRQNTVNPFAMPVIQETDDSLAVRLPKYFRDQGWANGMGFVQEGIRRYAVQTSVVPRQVIFDFSLCRWIDPLPLMSVLLEVANARHLGLGVVIRLPQPDHDPDLFEKGPYQGSPNRLLLFLAQEGFLDCLGALNDEGIRFSSGLGGNWDAYLNLYVKPSYEDARCIPMRMFFVPGEGDDSEFARRSVENLLFGIGSTLDSKIAPRTQERLIYKLRVALQEILHNAQEHAYETGTDPRLLAVYVRYRTGGLGLDSAGRQSYHECVKEERKHCPRLDKDWLTARPGCLEMFILDRGIGMVRSFERAGITLNWKHKFKEVMQKTFFDGLSTKPERQTRYGGLHLLHNLLSETGDFLRAIEGGIWFGCGVPLIRSTAATHSLTEAQAQMQGLAMHLRLGWKEETDHGGKWAEFGQCEQSEVWPELRLSEEVCASSFSWFESQIVIDERFGETKTYGNAGGWILWLVRPHRMKWDILSFILRTIVPQASGSTVLIIGDIPSYEAETYVAALDEFKAHGVSDWPKRFSRVILSTNRWRFAAVNYQNYDQRHGFSRLHEKLSKLRITPPPINPRPENFRLAIVRWLKWHDSRRLWEEVSEHRQMFIPEQISWGNDETGNIRQIAGYLDFPQTSHNNLCSAIYRGALARVLGVLPPDKVEFHPLDRLTLSVLREIHAAEVYEPVADSTETRLALGSVLVSGSTLESSSALPLDLHFFVHYSSSLRGSKPSLLFWLPKDHVSNTAPKLARIGRTAAIAPEGWKSFEVPRFDSQGKCVGGCNPQRTYEDWQSASPVIIKAGHWSYEGHHDFLTINIASAVEAAFLGKNELARFLASRILPFLGLKEVHVDEKWYRLLAKQPHSDPFQGNVESEFGLLVYRSHPSSDSVVRRLLDLLTPEGRGIALSRIFSVLPVRMRWSGSTFLIPPLVRENIRNSMISGDRVRPILLFDDAAITGRTLHDLRAALSAIGAKQVNTVVIANRLRQPAEGDGLEQPDYFWRLDVPVMGREGNCPLCHALNLAEAFSCSLAASNAKDEIKKWRRRWGETSPLDNWSAGLRPLPLVSPERQTKYCYRQSLDEAASEEEKHLARIDLIRSTGLSIHITELHAMTGRDDYCLKKIAEHNEPEVRVELAASQLLLFGNEFDLDIRIELVKTLIRELAQMEEDSPHTPLAALVAMGGLWLLDKESRLQAAETVHEDGWGLRSNYATKVLLAFLASETILDHGTAAYKIGKSILSTASWTLPQRFNEWFLETLSPRGNAHSEAIPLLIEELTQATEISDLRIKDAIDSLDHLADIIDGLERVSVRKEASGAFREKTVAMKTDAEEVRGFLGQRISGSIPDGWAQKTKQALEKYVIEMKYVADGYFHRIPSAQEYWKERTFETNALPQIIDRIDWERASEGKLCDGKPVEVRKRIIEFSQAGEISFDSNAGEVWIAWHRGIAGIVRDLLQNAVYADGQIRDPWDSGQDVLADLWVRVDYGKESVDLILANAAKCGSAMVYDKLKKHRWSHLAEVGGIVDVADVPQEGVAGVRVRIPYAAYLGS